MISKHMRGMVYWANLPPIQDSTVQAGRRPVIIVSNNVGNIFSGNVIIVPCTSNINKDNSLPTHTTLKLFADTTSVVLCENIRTIPKQALLDFIGMLDDQTMQHIDESIKIALGLVINEVTTLKINAKEPKKEFPEKISDEDKRKFLKDYKSKSLEVLKKQYNMTKKQLYQRAYYYKKTLTK